MTSREEFYRRRDQRSVEYGVHEEIFERPVGIVIANDAAVTSSGQIACLALINMAARFHRNLFLDIPHVKLHQSAVVSEFYLDEAAVQLARKVDPFIQLGRSSMPDASVGIGETVRPGLPCYIGADRHIAVINTTPVPLLEQDEPTLGACLSACLGAASLVKQVLGGDISPERISAWNYADGDRAERGPETLGPLDVGTILQVGAGGVGSSFNYWQRSFGNLGKQKIIDGDKGELHNTNRSLGLFPYHTGWPTGQPTNKARIAADLIGAEFEATWYNLLASDQNDSDLILPLANEREVRYQIACRGEPMLIHATTSRGWEAQLHRHILGRDDCIMCRMPRTDLEPEFICSTAKIAPESPESTDAALPFLSAAAGLMLLSALYRLQFRQLQKGRHNFWALRFRDVRGPTRRSIASCQKNCRIIVHRSSDHLLAMEKP